MTADNGPVRTMTDYYPEFVQTGPPLRAVEAWEGIIRPFARCQPSEFPLILDDLHAGATVLLDRGSLLHDARCERQHALPFYVPKLQGTEAAAFKIRVTVPPPPRHPRTTAIFPEISSVKFPNHPHLFRSGRRRGLPELPWCEDDALCAYRPGDGEWSWRFSDLVTYVDFVAIYLAKHIVWVKTGADDGGLWIGPQASHDPQDLLNEMELWGECRCGSGNPYARCCRRGDEAHATRNRVIKASLQAYRAQLKVRSSAA